MKLSEIIEKNGGLDICDDIWDWGIYFDYTKDSKEPYDQCMEFMANEIEFIKLNKNWYSPCKVCDFVRNHLNAFKKFFNEENREGYRPKDYENADKWDEDDGFFEAYMEGMESLIAGNYCDSDYEKLVKYLKEIK